MNQYICNIQSPVRFCVRSVVQYSWYLLKKVNFLFILYSTEIQRAEPNFFLGRFLFDLTFAVFIGYNIGCNITNILHLKSFDKNPGPKIAKKTLFCYSTVKI